MTEQVVKAPLRAGTLFHLVGFSFWQAWWLLAMSTETILPQAMQPAPLLNPVFCITVFTTLGYLAVALAGLRFGAFSAHRASYWCAGVSALLGSLGIGLIPLTGLGPLATALFFASCASFALGNALLLIMWGERWSSWASGRVGSCLGASYVFAFALYFVVALLPDPAGILLSSLLPIVSLVALSEARHEERRRPSQVDFEMESLSPWKVIVAVGAVGAIHGFVQCAVRLTAGDGAMSLSPLASGLVLAVIVAYLLVKQPLTASLALYRPIVPCFVGGLVLMVLLPTSMAALGNGFALTAVYCVDMLVMLVSTDIAFRTRTSVAVSFGLTLFAMRLGTTVGLVGAQGLALASLLSADAFYRGLLLCVIAIVVLGSFVFTAADLMSIYRAKPSEARETEIVGHVEGVARVCGLTPRESEVLSLLASGRSVPYIAGELCIAESTVKHHTSSIYRKIGVSDRQSLIDVIMQGAAGKGAL